MKKTIVTYLYLQEMLPNILINSVLTRKKPGWHRTPRRFAIERSTCSWRITANKDWRTPWSRAGLCSSWLWMWPQTRALCSHKTPKRSALSLSFPCNRILLYFCYSNQYQGKEIKINLSVVQESDIDIWEGTKNSCSGSEKSFMRKKVCSLRLWVVVSLIWSSQTYADVVISSSRKE